MKRVYCLYRVSTAQQVDVVKDDIPMQRIACHDFAAGMGWTILEQRNVKNARSDALAGGLRILIFLKKCRNKSTSKLGIRFVYKTGEGEIFRVQTKRRMKSSHSSFLFLKIKNRKGKFEKMDETEVYRYYKAFCFTGNQIGT